MKTQLKSQTDLDEETECRALWDQFVSELAPRLHMTPFEVEQEIYDHLRDQEKEKKI